MRNAVTESRGLQLIVLFMTLSYPFVLHLCIISGYPYTGVGILFTVAMAHSLRLLGSREFRFVNLLAPGIAALALISFFLDDSRVLYLPPIFMAAALLQLFAHTLSSDAEPLICQFARLGGIEDERSLRYARRLTWVWTLFFAFMLLESLSLALFAPIEIWSLFVNFINYILIIMLFLLEYLFRMIYFRRMPSVQAIKQAIYVFKPRLRTKG